MAWRAAVETVENYIFVKIESIGKYIIAKFAKKNIMVEITLKYIFVRIT